MGLTQELDAHRVVVFVGPGGVGKTTTAAAFALQAAMAGRQVLCLTVDPAKRLADSLGLRQTHPGEQRVPEELFSENGLQCTGRLWALMLDRKHTFDALVYKYAPSPERRQRILNNKFYQYISTSLAGTQEYMAMEKLLAVREDRRFDLIVLDTPPTTHTLDFLEAPQRLVNAVDSPVPRWFVAMLEGYRPLGILGKSAAFVLRGLSRFTGAEFLTQVAEFVTEINDMFGGLRQRANQVYDVLRAPDVAFVLVTAPTTQAVADAVFFGRKLAEYDIHPKGMVVNRVHRLPDAATEGEAELEVLLQRIFVQGQQARGQTNPHAEPTGTTVSDPAVGRAGDLATRMRSALADARSLGEADRIGIQRLRKQMGKTFGYVEIPAFDRDVHDLKALAAASHFFTGQAGPKQEVAICE